MINFYGLIHPFVSRLKNVSQIRLVNGDGSVNPTAIKDALNFGFPDITPRTMHRDGENSALEFSKLPNALYDYCAEGQEKSFGELLTGWFECDHRDWRKEFDALHAAACETVQKFLRDQGYAEDSCTYGKAQKVVNMTFKHIYCFSEGKKRTWFQECHMALDFFTLEWFKRSIAQHGAKYILGKVDNWSALQVSEEDEYIGKKDQRFYSYHFLVAKIREFFDDHKPFGPLFPLEAEFIIWPEIQTRLSAENFIFQLDPDKYSEKTEKRRVKDLAMEELIFQVEETISDYRKTAQRLTDTTEYKDMGYKIVFCPVCGSRTLDSHYICSYCQWEYDGVTEEDVRSSCNKMTVAEYRCAHS